MNIRILVTLFLCIVTHVGVAQGVFAEVTSHFNTRIGSPDRPFANTNIWGQFLAGETTTSLTPIGISTFYSAGGGFSAGRISVPNAPAFTTSLVQLVAWDSRAWGTNFNSVPLDQFGRTDIVGVFLTDGNVVMAPAFTQPAIVPIPEPSTWVLLTLGVFGLWLARVRR